MQKFTASSTFIFLFFAMIFCSSPKNNSVHEKIAVNNMSDKNLPVGMVELICTVKSIYEKQDGKYCAAQVNTVLGYGNSVKALSEGSEYEFAIDENIINEFQHSSIVGKNVRCKLVKMPKGMDLNSPDKLKIISIVSQ